MNAVTCDIYRELISADVDGELDADGSTALNAHLATCSGCTTFHDEAWALRRALRVKAADNSETPAQPLASPVDVSGSLRLATAMRIALFVIGGVLVIVNIGAIFSTDDSVAAHLGRHDGVFGTALGIGMLAVAAKPHRAIGLVPITSAVAILMIAVAIADLLTGNANLIAEAIHVVQFAGLVCLWIISGGPSRLPRHRTALGHLLQRVSPRRSHQPVQETPSLRPLGSDQHGL